MFFLRGFMFFLKWHVRWRGIVRVRFHRRYEHLAAVHSIARQRRSLVYERRRGTNQRGFMFFLKRHLWWRDIVRFRFHHWYEHLAAVHSIAEQRHSLVFEPLGRRRTN